MLTESMNSLDGKIETNFLSASYCRKLNNQGKLLLPIPAIAVIDIMKL